MYKIYLPILFIIAKEKKQKLETGQVSIDSKFISEL